MREARGTRRVVYDVIHPAAAAYIAAVILLATVVRTTLGFGEALVAVPLLALRLPIAVAAPLSVAVSVIVALLVVARDWRHVEVRSAGWLTLASSFGIPVGIHVLAHANDHATRAVLGAIIIAFGLSAVRGLPAARLATDSRVWLCTTGFVAGVMGGAYGMNGPPLAIYGTLRGWSPQRFRATLQGYFFIASLAGLVGYAVTGLLTMRLGAYFVIALPAVVTGFIVGRALATWMQPAQFVRAVYAGLVIVGAALIAEAAIR